MLNSELIKKFIDSPTAYEAIKIVKKCRMENLNNLGSILLTYFLSYFPKNLDLLEEQAYFYINNKEYEQAYDLYDKILQFNLTESESINILFNQHFCIQHVANRYINYNLHNIISKNPIPLITFTITTCKRYDLFEQTMNSFLNCCADRHLIDSWLCIDDNSSKEDRIKMQQKYPFFEFYFKTQEEKGHPRSMNIIRNKVTTPYIFHIEDDWKFITKKNYITSCLEILSENEKYGQCLINKNYSETEKDIDMVGGIFKISKNGTRYYIHEYTDTKEKTAEFLVKYNSGKNCSYWPHFSFRPSLLRKNILIELGEYDEKVSHFEMNYSYRYINAGYLSVFMEGIYCLHIGRLTSERHDSTKLNAYDLNGEAQLTGKEEKLASFVPKELAKELDLITKEIDLQPNVSETNKVQINLQTYVINLDRRSDRWEKFSKLEEPKFLLYRKFSAIDGTKLVPTERLQRIFDGNDYNMRQGMVGCALSHIQLYINLAYSKNIHVYCILEDDLDFVPNFSSKFLHLYSLLSNVEWDMCYLGHHVWPKKQTPNMYDKEKNPIIERWNTEKSFSMSMGGTGGYLITKKGAIKLLNYINKNGLSNGIDTIQQKAADELLIYYCEPHLIYSECWLGDSKTDTDIQHNFRSLTIPTDDRCKYLKDHYEKQGKKVIELTKLDLHSITFGEVIFYRGPNIKQLYTEYISKYNCFIINNQVLIIEVEGPNSNIKYERLIKNLNYDISDVLVYKKDFSVIPFGDMNHVNTAISKIVNIKYEYPFDVCDGGSFDIFALLLELTIKMNDEELKSFLEDFFDFNTNETYIQQWNKKKVFKSLKYKMIFPHDDTNRLKEIYFTRYKNLRNSIQSATNVYFVHATRWQSTDITWFYRLIDFVKTINPNVKLLTINGISDLQLDKKYENYITSVNVPYLKQFQNGEWPNEKIHYDNNIFAPQLQEHIKKFLT